MTVAYLDTSTVVRMVFGEPDPLESWGSWAAAYSSELMALEGRRSIHRARLTTRPDQADNIEIYSANLIEVERDKQLVPLTSLVLRRASLAFPTVVSTLDALHLATAVLLRDSLDTALVFATHDRQQALAAEALGFEVVGL